MQSQEHELAKEKLSVDPGAGSSTRGLPASAVDNKVSGLVRGMGEGLLT